jgi:hypothetical protein
MKATIENNNAKKYNTIEARHAALNYLFVNIAYIAASCDGKINSIEVEAIKKEFPFFNNGSTTLENLNTNPEYLYFCCQRILKFCNNNTQIINSLFVKIFKILAADGTINPSEISLLEKIVSYLKLPGTLIYKTFEIYFTPLSSDKIKLIKKAELKKQIASLHPDKFYSLNLKNENLKITILNLANNRLKILNEYYKKKLA